MTDTEQTALPPLFTLKDRCDRCGAQAKMLALLVPGLLLFCGHHGRQFEPGLASAGAQIEWA